MTKPARHRLNHQTRRLIQVRPILEQLEARRLLAADLQLDYEQPAAAWYARVDNRSLQADALANGQQVDEWFEQFVGPRQYQTHDWIVRLSADATRSLESIPAARSLLSQSAIDFQIVAGLGMPGMLHVRSLSRSTAEVETSLAGNSRVASFAANDKVGGQVLPNDSDFGNMTGLNNVGQFGATNDADIDAPEAWDITRGSPSVVVGVVDSGVDATHPDLYLNIWLNQGEIPAPKRSALMDTDSDGLFTFYDLNNAANAAQVRDLNTNGYIDAIDLLDDPLWADGRDTDGNGFTDDFFGWNFRTDSNETFAPNNPSDVLGHGTHVAGTIGAIGNNARGVTGINWRSSIMALKFLDENNQGDTASAIAAVNYATMMRTQFNTNVRVLNNSWGQPGGSNIALKNTIEVSGNAGILFVAAAGNGNILGQGVDNDRTEFYPASYEMDNVISVGASDGADRLAGFSNYGLRGVDIVAPGVGVRSTLPGGRYGEANGTSMATPHVSGSAALVWSLQPDATVSEIRRALLEQGDLIPAIGSQISTGRRLNANKSLAANVFAPTVQLVSAGNITTSGGTEQLLTVTYKNRLGVDRSSLGNSDIVITRQAALDETLTTTLVSSTENANKTEVTAIYRLAAVGGTWDAEDYGNYSITAKSDAARSLSGLASRETIVGSFQVKIAAAGIFYVDTFLDTVDTNPGDGIARDASGRTSLRAAIQEANALSPSPIKIFLQTGTYPLTIAPVIDPTVVFPAPGPGSGYDAPANLQWSNASSGDLDLRGNIALVGLGVNRTTVDAKGIDRVMKVYAGSTVSITGLTLTGGDAPANHSGGAILTSGNLSLDLVMIRNNQAIGGPVSLGGGIAEWHGALNMYRSTLDSNKAIAGGGVFITNKSTTKIDSSTLLENKADGRSYVTSFQLGGGGILTSNSGLVAVENSTFSGNAAEDEGLGNTVHNVSPETDGNVHETQVSGNGRYVLITSQGTYTQNSVYFGRSAYVLDRVTNEYDLVSVNSQGERANADSWANMWNSISDDGRYVAFLSSATNLSRGATGKMQNLYVRDRVSRTTTQVNVSSVGVQGNEVIAAYELSGDGRKVTIHSFADNLVPGDTNGSPDIFLHDLDTKQTTLVSRAASGGYTSGENSYPAINYDGRFVAFQSDSNGLVSNDINQGYDVYVRDNLLGVTEKVSINSTGDQAIGSSSIPSLSDDGRFVSFTSDAANLVTGDTNGLADIFVFDRLLRTTQRVSVSPTGEQANEYSHLSTISGNGKHVAFISKATNLVPDANTTTWSYYIVEIQTGAVKRVPVEGEGQPLKPIISNDGSLLAYVANAGAWLGVGDNDSLRDSFLINLATGGAEQLGGRQSNEWGYDKSSIFSSDGNQTFVYAESSDPTARPNSLRVAGVYLSDVASGTSTRLTLSDTGVEPNGDSSKPTISENKRFVAFLSAASNLVEGDDNGLIDLFLLDRQTERVKRIAATASGETNGIPRNPQVNASGTWILFESTGTQFVPDDANGVSDIFAYSIASESIVRLSTSTSSGESNGVSRWATISADGGFVAFASDATNLVSDDTNGAGDVFVKNVVSGELTRASLTFQGTQAIGSGTNTNAVRPVTGISGDGRFVVFPSSATNLVAGDTNAVADVFVRDREKNTTTRVSVSSSRQQANAGSFSPAISRNGRYVAFLSNATNLVSRDAAPLTQFYTYNLQTGVTDRVSFQYQAGRSMDNSFSINNAIANPTYSGDASLFVMRGQVPLFIDQSSGRAVSASRNFGIQIQSLTLNHITVNDSRISDGVLIEESLSGEMLITNSILPATQVPNTGKERPEFQVNGQPVFVDSVFMSSEALTAGESSFSPTMGFRGSASLPSFQSAGSLNPVNRDQFGQLRIGKRDAGSTELVNSFLSGKVYFDENENGMQDALEKGAVDVRVFIDTNSNGIFDSAEPFTFTLADSGETTNTNEAGDYRIESQISGFFPVVVEKDGKTMSSPSRGVASGWLTSQPLAVSLNYDGSVVAMVTATDNIVGEDRNGFSDIIVYDQTSGTFDLASKALDGLAGNAKSEEVAISRDGRFVAFTSAASNLVHSDSNGKVDVFVFDRIFKSVERVNLSNTNAQGTENVIGDVHISQDGRFVAFATASRLTADDDNTNVDVFIRDRLLGTVSRVTVIDQATRVDSIDGRVLMNASFSADFNLVTFLSGHPSLVPENPNGHLHVILLDLTTQRTDLLSVNPSGEKGNWFSDQPYLSGNGQFVTFVSRATNLFAGDRGSDYDVFVYDVVNRINRHVQQPSSFTIPVYRPILADDGQSLIVRAYTAAESLSGNIQVRFVSVSGNDYSIVNSSSYSQTNNTSHFAALSGDGSTVIYFGPSGVFSWRSQLGAGPFVSFRDASNATMEFALRIAPGSISGRLFQDTIRNEVRDVGEAGLEKQLVFLDQDGDAFWDSNEYIVETDALGVYRFNDVRSDRSYSIVAVPPQGMTSVSPSGIGWQVFVPSGGSVTDRDFGFIPSVTGGQFENAVLTGKLFNDLNGDGLIQNGESALVGVTVYLDLNGNEVRDFNEPRSVTDSSGSYSFTGLGNRPYTVRTLLGTGTVQTSPLGTKFATTSYTLTTGSTQLANPQDVITEDLNGDGWSDLAVALFSGNSVAIRLNDKAGGFGGAPISVSVAPDGLGPIALASGRLNSGSSVDMISANQLNGTATILLDFNGSGFVSKQTLAVGETPTDVVVGRFDADADFDAIVANQSTDQLTLLVNNGSGVFTKGASMSSGGKKPTALVTGLFNNDAFVDIAVANYGTHPTGGDFGNVAVLLGRGDGTFHSAVPYTVGFGPISIATDDFNGDGFLDLVTANFLANTASLLLGSANGTFAVASEQLATGQGPLQVQLQDIEGDGDKDILVTNLLSQTISVLRNRRSQGGSGFEPAENFGVAEFSTAPRLAFAAGDFDKSSTADIAIINSLSDSLKIMRNTLVNGAHRIQLTGVENVANLNFGTRPDVLMPRMDPIENPETLVEDAPEQTVTLHGIALGRTGGPGLFITASSANPAIVPNPTVSYSAGEATGQVRFTPTPNASGLVAITVTARDAGADRIMDNADDAVLSRLFTVSIKPVNDAPTFDLPASRNVTALEDSGARTVTGFVTHMTAGGGTFETTQTLSTFLVVADNLGLFSVQPMIDATGTLRFTPAANAVGTATVSVTLSDNGDTAFGGSNRRVDQFVLTINPVNDAPSINIGGKQTVLVNAAAQTVNNFATGFAPGGGSDENAQVIAGFVISVDRPELFSVLPTIDSTGTLRYTPSMTRTGIAKVSVQVRDDGGSSNGGVDLSILKQFDIEVAPLPDTVAPTPVMSSLAPLITNVSPVDLTVDFGEAVTGFALSDLVMTNASASNLVDLGTGKFTLSVSPITDGVMTVSIPAGAARDLGNNNSLVSASFSRTVDRLAPTPAISSTSTAITNQASFNVAIDLGEIVTGFAANDFIVTNATSSNFQDLGAGKYSATLTAIADGVVTIQIPAAAARDRANNDSLASNVLTRTVDTKAPSVNLISTTSAITNISPIDLTVDFGESVVGFALSDLALTNATAANLIDFGAGKFTVAISPVADGVITVNIPASAARDLANNNSLVSTSLSRTVDRVAPVATITTTETSPTNKQSFPIVINFGEALTGFDANDLVLGNATVANLVETAPGRYTATVNAIADGVVLVGFSAGIARDVAGNGNTAPVPLLVSVNTGAATYKPLLSTTESAITPNRTFSASIDFGRVVTGFVAADLELTNATATISDLGNGRYQMSLTAINDGNVVIRLPADRVRDANNRPNDASEPLTVRFVDTTNSDFGDAPSSAQSGFASSYPTRLVDNGAFHRRSALFLGTSSDAEPDGQPHATATGDDTNVGDDENGILFPLSNIIGVSASTTSSFIATASANGFLDAWIDFNRDGDWADAGEQVASRLALVSGSNSVAFTIPANASAGTSFARFRISTAGGLAVTGPAVDGEVEDHSVTLVSGASKTVSLKAVDLGPHEIMINNGLLVVRSGSNTLWSAPATEISKFTTLGANDAKIFEVFVPGTNLPGTVRYTGSGQPIELISNRPSIDLASLSSDKLFGLGVIDLRTTGLHQLTVRSLDVSAINVAKSLRILMDANDTLIALADWKSGTGRMESGAWVQPFTSGDATIEIVSATAWQNEVNPFDVDGDSGISPLDVLDLINVINLNVFPNGNLPSRGNSTAKSFLDTNGDGRVDPLDVLKVINELNRSGSGEGEGEGANKGIHQQDTMSRSMIDRAMAADLSSMLGDLESESTWKRQARNLQVSRRNSRVHANG